jgi:hypothetical protein
VYLPSDVTTCTTPDPINTPIDGGLSLLLAAGIAYGTKKMYNKKEEKGTG